MPVRLRHFLVVAVLAAAVVVFAAVTWQDQRISVGLLLAATLSGLSTGSIFAIAASGIAISYATSGIFNFASGAIGMFMAFLYWDLRVGRGWPTLWCLILVVGLAAPALGAALDLLVMNRLRDAPLPQQLVATVGVMLGLMGLTTMLWPPTTARALSPFFENQGFEVLGGITFTWHRTIAIITACVVALLLWILLNRTNTGLAMRAVVNHPELAETYGVSSRRASMTSWAVGSTTAAIAGILLAPEVPLSVSTLTLLIIDAFAAVVIGQFRKLSLVFAGGLLIGLLNSYAISFLDLSGRLSNVRSIIPTLALFIALLVLPQVREQRRGSSGGDDGGMRLRLIPDVRAPTLIGTGSGMIALCGASLVAALLLPTVTVNRLTQAMSLAVIMLSLVLLTGWAGETSLAQLTFAGFGAVAMITVAGDSGSPAGLVAAALVGGLVGLVVALPALRLQGIYLALASLAIARIAEELIFPQDGLLSSASGAIELEPLSISGWRLDSPRSGLVALAVAFGLLAVGLVAVRRSRFGRRLHALKDSPEAYEALGLNVRLSRVAIYVVSASMAGFGGALFASVRNDAGTSDFTMLGSVALLLLLVVGGVSTVGGALLGALLGVALLIVADEWPSGFLTGLTLLGPGVAAIGVTQTPAGAAGAIGEAFRGLIPERLRPGGEAAFDGASAADPGAEAERVEDRLETLGLSRDYEDADLSVMDDVLCMPEGYRVGRA